MLKLLYALPFLLLSFSGLAQKIVSFDSGSDASFRGMHALSGDVCWFSGSDGTVLKTTDGGKTFFNVSPVGYDTLQFRDIHAFDSTTALILSAGLPAVILKTIDGGKTWKETYRNKSEGIFFDGMDFWDNKAGIAFSDPPKNKLIVIKTIDQGETWTTIDTALLPAIVEKQGGFAASGTSICTFDNTKVVIGLGGASSTLLYSVDAGLSWTKTELPLSAENPASGIFSIDFLNTRLGFAVGGNYMGDSLSKASAARTINGGLTWHAVTDTNINGLYRSCVKYVTPQKLIAVSRTGISLSKDGGLSWERMKGDYYTISIGVNKSIWLSGSEGRVAKLKW